MADHMTARKTNAKLYKALSEGDDTKVCQICRDLVDGPFHILTIHNDSVLHTACYYKRNDLALHLLSLLPQDQSNKLTMQSDEGGNTILHTTATNNNTIEAAAEMLRRAPSLLTMTNDLGETPLFRAARYGKSKFFYYLKDKVGNSAEADLWKLLQRNDKATILHAAIQSENFELAHDIAKTFPILIGQQDGDSMTGLQLLCCKPSAFDNEFKDDLVKRFICKFIDPSSNKGSCRVPIVKEIRKQIVKSESVKKLATLLIESDASWEATESMSNHDRIKLHKYGTTAHVDSITTDRIPYSPLLLATKSGCTEIVKEILKVYPQAVEHIDEDGRDILHVAIKYRRMDIYKTVINMKNPLMRLRGKIDKQGNSILHMVGMKVRDQRAEGDIRSPALILRDELLLFENVKKICTKLATVQVNKDKVTAEQLFTKNNAQLRIDAKEWMKSTAEHCTIVAVLIATVAFAAAYTVPGGPNQNTGYPLLKSKPLFMLFTVADALSLTFSLTSVIIFLSILTSSFRLKDFQTSLHNKLLLGLTVLILSVSMMMVAFAATLILTISSGRKWTNFILYIISFFPITVFVCSYVNLYKLLIKAFGERVKDIIACLKATWNLRNHSLPEGNVESHLISQHFGLGSQAPTTSTESSTKTLV